MKKIDLIRFSFYIVQTIWWKTFFLIFFFDEIFRQFLVDYVLFKSFKSLLFFSFELSHSSLSFLFFSFFSFFLEKHKFFEFSLPRCVTKHLSEQISHFSFHLFFCGFRLLLWVLLSDAWTNLSENWYFLIFKFWLFWRPKTFWEINFWIFYFFRDFSLKFSFFWNFFNFFLFIHEIVNFWLLLVDKWISLIFFLIFHFDQITVLCLFLSQFFFSFLQLFLSLYSLFLSLFLSFIIFFEIFRFVIGFWLIFWVWPIEIGLDIILFLLILFFEHFLICVY